MRQQDIVSAIARATGESNATIKSRGFGLLEIPSRRATRRRSPSKDRSDSAQLGDDPDYGHTGTKF